MDACRLPDSLLRRVMYSFLLWDCTKIFEIFVIFLKKIEANMNKNRNWLQKNGEASERLVV